MRRAEAAGACRGRVSGRGGREEGGGGGGRAHGGRVGVARVVWLRCYRCVCRPPTPPGVRLGGAPIPARPLPSPARTRAWRCCATAASACPHAPLPALDDSLAPGLRFEDIFSESTPDVATAISRLPEGARNARQARLRRALDVSFKKKDLPYEIQDIQLPYSEDLQPLISEANFLRVERKQLSAFRGF